LCALANNLGGFDDRDQPQDNQFPQSFRMFARQATITGCDAAQWIKLFVADRRARIGFCEGETLGINPAAEIGAGARRQSGGLAGEPLTKEETWRT
jgi:hypothetical protein